MLLGIEIGGTKLQLGVGAGRSDQLIDLVRYRIDRELGARGILSDVERIGRELIEKYGVTRIGIGFGGPVDRSAGLVITSHQVSGWKDFPVVHWCNKTFGLPAVVINDCDAAALAEARYGAGVDASPLLYVTVGTGVGAGLIVDGRVYYGQGVGATEIGHLHTEPSSGSVGRTVESVASGLAIAEAARRVLSKAENDVDESRLLNALALCGGDLDALTAKDAAFLARGGDTMIASVFETAARTLGWGIAQAVTLFSPARVVVGGGVSLAGDELFFNPLQESLHENVVRTFRGSFDLKPAALGEEVVVHGALATAFDSSEHRPRHHLRTDGSSVTPVRLDN